MIDENGGIITTGFDNSIESMFGKFTVADTPKAKQAWELFRKNPEEFEFAAGYIQHEDGTKELVEISLISTLMKDKS